MHLKTLIFFLLFCCIETINAQQVPYAEHYDNGQLKAEGYKTSTETNIGKWTFYRKDGSLDAELTFNEVGELEGSFQMYFRNGQLQTKGTYSGEGFYEMEGDYEDYYQNGQTRSIGIYKQNKPIGNWKEYFENGQIKSQSDYTNQGIIQTHTAYFQNGQLRLDAQYNKNGDLIGEVIVYYTDGQIHTEQNYDELGNKTGTYKSYYQNGNLMEIGEYAGVDYFQKKAEWKTYYENGQLKTLINYDSKGKRIGEIFRFEEK